MKKAKAPRKKSKNKSIFDINSNEIGEYASQIPEVIFLIFMIYFGISIYTNHSKNEIYQKYIKKSFENDSIFEAYEEESIKKKNKKIIPKKI